MSSRVAVEVVETMFAGAAGVAMMGWWIRKFRRARQSWVGLVEAEQPIEVQL